MSSPEGVRTPVRGGLTAAQLKTRLCGKCGSHELHRKPLTLFTRIFSLGRYACGRCANRQTKFRPSMATFVTPVALVLLAFGVRYLILLVPPTVRPDQLGADDALSRARTSAGGLSTFEQMIIRKPQSTLNNAAVIKLWQAKVGTDVILRMIRTSVPDFDVSPTAIIELKEAGVDESIILAIIDAPYNVR